MLGSLSDTYACVCGSSFSKFGTKRRVFLLFFGIIDLSGPLGFLSSLPTLLANPLGLLLGLHDI